MKKTVNPRSLKNLRSWQEGQSGNPGGRPRKLLTEAYQTQLARIKEGDPLGRTYAEAIVDAQIQEALKGNIAAAKEIADRTEGKTGQAVEFIPEAAPDLHLHVNFVDSDSSQPCAKISGSAGEIETYVAR